MNTVTPVPQGGTASGAQERLVHSRAQIDRWLAQDLQTPGTSSALGSAVRNALPLLNGLRTHPGTAVVLGALAQAWLRSSSPAPSHESTPRPLDVVVTMTRRHPKTALITAGVTGLALWWWNRAPTRQLPP